MGFPYSVSQHISDESGIRYGTGQENLGAARPAHGVETCHGQHGRRLAKPRHSAVTLGDIFAQLHAGRTDFANLRPKEWDKLQAAKIA